MYGVSMGRVGQHLVGATLDGSPNIPVILIWSVPSVAKCGCKKRSNITPSQRKSKRKKFHKKIVTLICTVPTKADALMVV